MHSRTSEAPTVSSVLTGVAAMARSRAEAVALDGAQRLRYAELQASIERCAAELDTLPPGPLAWQLDEDWRWVVLDLACLLNGRPAIPLPGFFTPAQIRRALAAAGCEHVVHEDVAATATLPHGRLTGRLPSIGATVRHPGFASAGGSALPPCTAKVTFTSGSTGAPKGVCLGQTLMERVANALNERLANHSGDAHLAALPLAVLLENVAGLYRCLLAGGRYILPRPGLRGLRGSSTFEARRLALAVRTHSPARLIATPGMLAAMTGSDVSGAFRRLDYVAVGGAPLPPGVLSSARAAGIPAYEGYGLSECGSVVSLNVPGDDQPGTVGRPLPHLHVTRESGELQVHGASFLGYAGQPPTGTGPVATGDAGALDESGRLVIHGRLNNRIITPMGRNIAPEWLETELAGVLPDRMACVVDDRGTLAAVIPARDTEVDSVTAAVERVNRALPDYARLPYWIAAREPFTVANGCLTANGRLRRSAIQARHLRGRRHSVPTPANTERQQGENPHERYTDNGSQRRDRPRPGETARQRGPCVDPDGA